MARTTSVQTATGSVTVKQGINRKGDVTGRVGGVTYKGASWPDVERQIQAAYAVEYRWERWLRFQVEADKWRLEGYEPDQCASFEFRWKEALVSQQVSKPWDGWERTGYMVLDEDRGEMNDGSLVPVFKMGDTVEKALGGRCLPWTEEREAWARGMVERVRATAAAARKFLERDDLALAVTNAMAISAAPEENS